MVQLGKVYGNLMVDLRATNAKLWDRGARIISTVTGLPRDRAMELLKEAGGHVKLAIVMQKRGVSADEARRLLEQADGRLRGALQE
jgi:N-acetylmuramic acid 6-phosphate etherase